MATIITISEMINQPIDKVWKCWTTPENIINWNNATEDWHTLKAENNLVKGGKFNYRMEAKDGSHGFDFCGTYNKIDPYNIIEYTIDDNRKVRIEFSGDDKITKVIESFEAEDIHSIEMQYNGWLAILRNFKKYCESYN